ncbi:unnamed protein product [Sphagnum compactum]
MKAWEFTLNEAVDAYDAKRAMIGYYVTVIRGTGPSRRIGWLAGPFKTHAEAEQMVDATRLAAGSVNPWTVFDAFGTAKLAVPSMSDKIKFSGKLNDTLNLVRLASGYVAKTPESTGKHYRKLMLRPCFGYADRAYAIYDAATVTMEQVKAGIEPKLVGSYRGLWASYRYSMGVEGMRHISGKITCDKVTLGKVFSNTRSRGLETVCNRKAKYARMSAGEGSIVARNEFRGYKLSGLEAFLAAEIYMRSYLPPAGEPVKPRAPAFGRPLPRRVQEAALQASRLDRAEAVTLGQMVAEVRQAGDTVSAATGLHSRYDAAK